MIGYRTRQGHPVGILVALTIGSTLLLSGCSDTTTEEDPTMDHVEAAAELDGLMMIAQTAVGGEWKNLDSGARACALPSGDTGAQFLFTRTGGGVSDELRPSAVTTVSTEWEAAGLTPTTTEKTEGENSFTEVIYPESGSGVDDIYVRLQVSGDSASLQGQTRCVPGDYAQINRDAKASQTTEP